MPILLILLVTAACLPVPWPRPPFGFGPRESAILTLCVIALPLSAMVLLSRWVVVSLERHPERRIEVVQRYIRIRRWLSLINLGLACLTILACGWGWTVWQTFLVDVGRSRPILAPAAEALVPLPYFVLLFGGWSCYFAAERAVYRTSSRGQREPNGFWSLPGYLLFHARQFALLIVMPVGLFTTQQAIARFFPEIAESPIYQISTLVLAVAIFLLLPRAIKPLLGLKSLPAGPVRERLEATARRIDLRYTDLLIWPTRGAVANAMVIGVVPWARYVIFTDRLLDGLAADELDAVFGHEAGHVAHQHIPYYALFFVLSAAAASAVVAAGQKLMVFYGWTIPREYAGWLTLPPVLLLAGYVFVVFGFLSRRCERQADLYGCRVGSCDTPWCHGHDERTVYPAGDRGLCRTGVLALVRALDRVDNLNGIDGIGSRMPQTIRARAWAWLKAWQHGPVSARIEFLLRLSEDPTLGDRHDKHVYYVRIFLAVILLIVVTLLTSYVGWNELWRMM